MTFDSVTAKGYTYGSGAITDGIHKLAVCISQFIKNPAFIDGAHVLVNGEVKVNKTRKSFKSHFICVIVIPVKYTGASLYIYSVLNFSRVYLARDTTILLITSLCKITFLLQNNFICST